MPGAPERTTAVGAASFLVQVHQEPAKGRGAVKGDQENQEAAVSEKQENTDFLKLGKDKQCQVVQCQVSGKLERESRNQSTRTSLVTFQERTVVVLEYQTSLCYMKQCRCVELNEFV